MSKEILNKYINQITKDEKLCEAINDIADIRFIDKTVLEDDFNDLVDEEIFESNYVIEPFAKNAAGDFYVLLNNKYVGYIEHEGSCGIIASSVDDFFRIIGNVPNVIINIKKQLFESIDNFMDFYNEEMDELKKEENGIEHLNIVSEFLKENNLEEDTAKIYETLKNAIETKPEFLIKVREGIKDYEDYDDLLGTNFSEEFENYQLPKQNFWKKMKSFFK